MKTFYMDRIYVPLQISGEGFIKDMDEIFTRDGKKVRVIVKDCRLISEELLENKHLAGVAQ